MSRKAVSGITLTLLFIGMLTLAFNIQPVKASGTIYIRADGSVEPDTAPISSVDNVTYTFTNNIYDEIVVERNDIVVDGAGYTLQGLGSGKGIELSSRSKVTIKNMEIKGFGLGIWLQDSSHNNISGNNIGSGTGVWLENSPNNIILGNNVTGSIICGIRVSPNNTVSGNNIDSCQISIIVYENTTISRNTIVNGKFGVQLSFCSNSILLGNNIANNWEGIGLLCSANNTISGNNLINNHRGIHVFRSSNNKLFHNSFTDNTQQVYFSTHGYANVWDDGYPSGGNYWSDYNVRYPDAQELDDSSIWDTPYVIDENNQDNYPLIEPWTPLPRTIDELKTEIEQLGSEGEIDNRGIVKSLIAKLNVAQKLVDKGKIDEAKSILQEDFIPQVQNLTDIHITPEAAEILIKSAEHIISHQ